MLKKGMVIKLKNKYAIVATDDSEFLRIKNKPGMHVGQKLYFEEEDCIKVTRPVQTMQTRRNHRLSGSMVALAACIMLIVMLVKPFGVGSIPAYAVVTLDINPSFELTIDENYKVLAIRGVNQDSINIVDEGLRGMSLDNAIREMILDVEAAGVKITDKSGILVSTVVLDQVSDKRAYKKVEKEIIEGLDEAFEAVPALEEAKVVFIEATEKELEKASDENLSVGKYKLIEMSEEDDKYNVLEDKTIGDLIQRKDIIEDIIEDEDKVILDGEDIDDISDYMEQDDDTLWLDDFEEDVEEDFDEEGALEDVEEDFDEEGALEDLEEDFDEGGELEDVEEDFNEEEHWDIEDDFVDDEESIADEEEFADEEEPSDEDDSDYADD